MRITLTHRQLTFAFMDTVRFQHRSTMPYILLGILLLFTGCALRQQEKPVISADATAPPPLTIPTVRERMLYLARQEWTLFGQPEADYDAEPPVLTYPSNVTHGYETLPPFFSRILMYWQTATDLPLIGQFGEISPWSAAFMVWLARSAGVPESDLPSTVLHWDYIEHIMESDAEPRFKSHAIDTYAPKPGDIICAPRGEAFSQSIRSYKDLKRGAYHCDLVVAQHPGEIEVIGGNVVDAVSLAHVKLDSAGKVLPTKARRWSLVIEQRN